MDFRGKRKTNGQEDRRIHSHADISIIDSFTAIHNLNSELSQKSTFELHMHFISFH